MEKPDLTKLWETFIRFSWDELSSGKQIDVIREKVAPAVSILKAKGEVGWYCFVINNRKTGVPTSEDDDDLYFHIRFALEKHINPVDVLPSYCVFTRKVEPEWVKTITIDSKGTQFDTSLFKEESIESVWKILGEQSEWLLNLLNAFKENINIPTSYVERFIHYYTDMTGLVFKRNI